MTDEPSQHDPEIEIASGEDRPTGRGPDGGEPRDELGAWSEAVLHPQRPRQRRGNSLVRWTGYVIGLGLLAWCVREAVRGSDWGQISRARPWQVVALIGLVWGNLLCNAVMFLVAMRPFERAGRRRIGIVEWFFLIGTSELLNYLPKVGLIGRAVYLKRRHDIAYRASLLSMVMIAGGIALVYAALIAVTLWRGVLDWGWVAAIGALMIVGVIAAGPVVRRVLRRFGIGKVRSVPAGLVVWTLACGADALCFAGRFYIAAQVIGIEVPFAHALILAIVGNLIELGLPVGFREFIGGWLWSLTGLTLQQGVGVVVFDRIAATATVLVVGLIGMAYLGWGRRATADPVGPDRCPDETQ